MSERERNLEEGEASVVFKQDAADAPDVTGVTPAQLWGVKEGARESEWG